MAIKNGIPNRQSIRLQNFDYSNSGLYFITICTQGREHLFGNIDGGSMLLNEAGQMVKSVWNAIPERFPHADIDEFIIMPDHMHGIIALCRGEPCVRPLAGVGKQSGEHKVRPYGTAPGSIGRIVQAFKSITTNEYS